MNRLSATSLITFLFMTGTTALGCSSADTLSTSERTEAPACTDCASSAVVAAPAPSASAPAPKAALTAVGSRVVAGEPFESDAGATPSSDGAPDASDTDGAEPPSRNCTIVEHDSDAGGFEWEVVCP